MNPITLIKYPTAEAFIQAHTQWLLDSIAALENAGTMTPEFAQSQREHQAKQNVELIDKINTFGCCFYSDPEKTTVHGWWDASISDRNLFLHLANELWTLMLHNEQIDLPTDEPPDSYRNLTGKRSAFVSQADLLFDLWEQAHTPPRTSHRSSVLS